MRMALYMAVTPDKWELPLFVAGNVRELANKYGVTENAVYSSIARNESGKQRGAKFIKVKMAKEEEIKKKICGERPTQHICSDGCMKGNDKCALSVAIKALEEVQQYRAIGTPEECRAAVEKQTARKATTNHSWTHYHFFCPVCNMEVNDMKYCPNCGQKLDWSDEQ